MVIKALKTFSDGVTSLVIGEVTTVADVKANVLIADGLAMEYNDTITITENGNYDVTDKNNAVVNVALEN